MSHRGLGSIGDHIGPSPAVGWIACGSVHDPLVVHGDPPAFDLHVFDDLLFANLGDQSVSFLAVRVSGTMRSQGSFGSRPLDEADTTVGQV